MGTQSPEVMIIRAHGADFQVGEGGGGANCECVGGSKLGGRSGGMLPWENFKFKSSEMAINASKPKTANSNINL